MDYIELVEKIREWCEEEVNGEGHSDDVAYDEGRFDVADEILTLINDTLGETKGA